MYSHPYVKIIKTDDNSFVIETEEKYKKKTKKNSEPITTYETKTYVAKDLNDLLKKLKGLIPKLKSATDVYTETFDTIAAEA